MVHNLIVLYFFDYLYKINYDISVKNAYIVKLNIDKYEQPDVCFLCAQLDNSYKIIPANPESFSKLDYGVYSIDISNLRQISFFKKSLEKGTVRLFITKNNVLKIKFSTFTGKVLNLEFNIEKLDKSAIENIYPIIENISILSEDEKVYEIVDFLNLYGCLHDMRANPNMSIVLCEDKDGKLIAKCADLKDESDISKYNILHRDSLKVLFDFEQYLMLFVYGMSVFENASSMFSVYNSYPNYAIYMFYTEVEKEKAIMYYSVVPIDRNFEIRRPELEIETPNIEVEDTNEEISTVGVESNETDNSITDISDNS
mgnify:CR=1 FL=1